jgi:hypothetical protein
MELTCEQYVTSIFKKNFGTHNTNNLAIVLVSDDQGDYETIHKMHRLLMTDNNLFNVLEVKEHMESYKGRENHY